MRGDPQLTTERGRNLPGDGISQKCRVGRHGDCTAERCQCACMQGAIPSLLKAVTERDTPNPEIHVELPSGAVARVDPAIQPETLTALDEMMKAVVKQAERDIFKSCGIDLERSKPSDEVTFASLTAGLGRRGTGR